MKYSTSTPATPATSAVIKLLSTGQLVSTFIQTGEMIDAGHPDTNLYTVRGWIMDELEARDPEAFNAWLDSDTDDAGLLEFFNC